MKIIGSAPINPIVFYTGKFAGYAVWLVWVLSASGAAHYVEQAIPLLQRLSFITFGVGLVVVALSLIKLGRSTSLGLPDEETELVTKGLYRFSRHPMYLGFHLFTVSAVLYTLSPLVIVASLYSVVVYHYIIKAEEQFLHERFGPSYEAYRSQVRRYL